MCVWDGVGKGGDVPAVGLMVVVDAVCGDKSCPGGGSADECAVWGAMGQVRGRGSVVVLSLFALGWVSFRVSID